MCFNAWGVKFKIIGHNIEVIAVYLFIFLILTEGVKLVVVFRKYYHIPVLKSGIRRGMAIISPEWSVFKRSDLNL